MRVLFVDLPDARELPAGEHYAVGTTYDLPEDKAYRWMNYGRAIEAPPEPAPEFMDPLDALAAANPAAPAAPAAPALPEAAEAPIAGSTVAGKARAKSK